VPLRPLPPKDLINRVGWVVGDERATDVFLARGAEQWRLIKSLLGEDWDWRGKRGLDFGCGIGRILRHAAEEEGAEFWGCDIDEPSVDWLAANLSPPLHVLRNGESPPLELPDEHFDVIWAFSVFTHLMDPWSAWLMELHRMLKPDGRLIATVFGPAHTEFGGEPVSEEIIGMNVMYPGASWDSGGPLVLHSRWWLDEHWGRAFEILHFRIADQDGSPPLYGQSALLLRKRPGSVTVAELERVELADAREWAALGQQARSLRREAMGLNEQVNVYANSRSWKLTAPLRAIAVQLRRLRGGAA
jgi:SAM-dependent methyltransferase